MASRLARHVTSLCASRVTRSIPTAPIVAFSFYRRCQSTAATGSTSLGPLIISPPAARRLKTIQKKQLEEGVPNAQDLVLRVTLSSGGCSGFKYTLALEHGPLAEDDVIIDKDGAKVAVDKASLDLLEGSTVDFVEDIGRTGFVVVNNPKAAGSCGCGSSFTVKS